MKYVVFESGSRAGYSVELFFRAWQMNHLGKNVSLMMADSDADCLLVPSVNNSICRISDAKAFSILTKEHNVRVFPGDELTRQRNRMLQEYTKLDPYSSVKDWFYDKVKVNTLLTEILGSSSIIRVPKTFNCSDVFSKPSTMSAGSKGIEHHNNICVSEYIDIDKEYVVDVLEKDGIYSIYARETKLRCGYDKLIKFIDNRNEVIIGVNDFLERIHGSKIENLFRGIFHLQIAQDKKGTLYYIEASKRISGTSIVNLLNGHNPFDILEDTSPQEYDYKFYPFKWYRYEDILSILCKVVKL